MNRTFLIALASLFVLSWTAMGQSTQPADSGEQVITVEGNAHVTIDGTGVHVTPSTQPADRSGKPTTRPGHMTIRMSNNTFNNNGGGKVPPKTITATEAGKPADNPLKSLSADGVALLKKRGVDIEAMQAMKAVLITDEFYGASRKDIVNTDPNLVVVLGKGFGTHGSITSAGPILATEDANFMGAVHGDSIVWFVDKTRPRSETTGSPVICSPDVAGSMWKIKSDEVWIGKYGWGK